jgi:hypothetical protein
MHRPTVGMTHTWCVQSIPQTSIAMSAIYDGMKSEETSYELAVNKLYEICLTRYPIAEVMVKPRFDIIQDQFKGDSVAQTHIYYII